MEVVSGVQQPCARVKPDLRPQLILTRSLGPSYGLLKAAWRKLFVMSANTNSNNNSNSNSHNNVYYTVICHCKSSPSSFDERSMSIGRLLTFRPSQSAWDTDLPKLTAIVLHSPLPSITTQSEIWYSFLT